MTRRGWIIAVVMFSIGLAIGGGGVEAYHRIYARRAQQIFSQKLRCKDLADRYAKNKSDEDLGAFSLRTVDYSMVSNSCVAYFEKYEILQIHRSGKLEQHNHITWQVVDLLTGETLYEEGCDDPDNCWDGRHDKFQKAAEATFDEAVNGKKSDPKGRR